MPTQISAIETMAREQLEELSPRHWTSAELTKIIDKGIKDLWRSIVDLKGEYFLVVNTDDVYLAANTDTIQGVPNNVYKVYSIEPEDTTDDSTSAGRYFSFRPFTTIISISSQPEPKTVLIHLAAIPFITQGSLSLESFAAESNQIIKKCLLDLSVEEISRITNEPLSLFYLKVAIKLRLFLFDDAAVFARDLSERDKGAESWQISLQRMRLIGLYSKLHPKLNPRYWVRRLRRLRAMKRMVEHEDT